MSTKYNHTCNHCGNSFISEKRKSTYCSFTCSGLARRQDFKEWTDDHGYIRMNVGGKTVRKHRYVMEQHIGRILTPSEHVHHINGNKHDNRVENLLITNVSDHAKMHSKTFRDDTHKECTDCHCIKPRSEFYPQRYKPNGDPNYSRCKTCFAIFREGRKDYHSSYYQEHKEAWQKPKTPEQIARLNEYELQRCIKRKEARKNAKANS